MSTPAAPHHRVLIVDDEEATRLLLARIVSRDVGAEVDLAGTCEQALRLAGSYSYDAILLDLMMPGIGGFGVLREIRAASPNMTTPIVIVSVLASKEHRARCLSAGANAYIEKPIERTGLARAVKAQIA